MDITFLLPHIKISGGVKALLEYANRLQSMGHRVRIFIPAEKLKWYHWGKRVRVWRKGPPPLDAAGVDWFDCHVPIQVLPRNHSQFIPRADILVASAWQTAQSAAKLPDDRGKRFYFIQHDESLWTREKTGAEKTYRLPFQKIVISTWLKEILSKKHQQEAVVLVTPVDKTLFYCKDKSWNSPRRVCLLHHDYDWKGYKDGIAAIREVRSQNQAVDLVVFGEKLKDPRSLYEDAGFDFEYHYRPTGDRLRKIYASCDIYLCPSWYEGLGMPPMEAMACRCALVTTDTGGCRDYAIHGETALVSPPREAGKLAENLAAVLRDERLMRTLAENGHRKILEFDWDENCRRLVHLFEKSLHD